jgi:hypothetical protein
MSPILLGFETEGRTVPDKSVQTVRSPEVCDLRH